MGIPEISDQELHARYERIKPVVRYAEMRMGGKSRLEEHAEGDHYHIEDVDLRRTAFTWAPKPTTRAPGLIELDTIATHHTYGYQGFFKPSIAEVLAQIPEEYLGDVVAFETHYKGMSGKYHSGHTILYRQKSVAEIDQEMEHRGEHQESLVERVRGV